MKASFDHFIFFILSENEDLLFFNLFTAVSISFSVITAKSITALCSSQVV